MIKKSLDPVWDETFVSTLGEGTDYPCKGGAITLTLWDWDRLTKDDVIGAASIGGDAVRRSVQKVRDGLEGTVLDEMEIELDGQDGKRVVGRDMARSSVTVRLCVERLGGVPERVASGGGGEVERVASSGAQGAGEMAVSALGDANQGGGLSLLEGGGGGMPQVPPGRADTKVPVLSLGGLSRGGGGDAAPGDRSGGTTPRSDGGTTPRTPGGSWKKAVGAAKKAGVVGEAPGKRKKREQVGFLRRCLVLARSDACRLASPMYTSLIDRWVD